MSTYTQAVPGRLHVFSGAEWAAMVLGYVLLVLVLFTLGIRQNEAQQLTDFDSRSRAVATSMGVRVGEVRTLLTTIVGMHYASDGFRNVTLAGFADSLESQTPYVTLLGRFNRVPADQRTLFEQSMAERGLYRFAIQQPDEQGNRQYDSKRDTYYPVSYVEPMAPATLAMVGNNLGAIASFRAQIEAAAMSNASFVSKSPSHWPLREQLLLIKPVYRGKYVPLEADLRSEQADGGYWLAIDLADILETTIAEVGDVAVQVKVRDTEGVRTVYHHEVATDEGTWQPQFYKPRTITHRWTVGTSTLELGVTGQLQLGTRFILFASGALVGVSIVYGLLMLAGFRRRLAERDRQLQQRALFQERERAERTLDAITDVVLSLDNDVCLLHMNPAAESWTGVTNELAVGQPLSCLLNLWSLPEHEGRFDLAAALDSLGSTELLSQDVCLLDEAAGQANAERIVNLSISRTLDTHGEPTGYIMVLRDVSIERKLTRELEFQANHDPLTGCFNRRHFERHLAELIETQTPHGQVVAVLYMDLDQFKVVNDTCGHTAGDRLLIELTDALNALIGPHDMLSRLGGDEFGLIIKGRDLAATHAMAESVFGLFQKFVFSHAGQVFAVRASLGLVVIDEHSGTIEDVLSAADIACYTAKDNGRNGLCVYSGDDESMTRRHQEMNWAPRLQQALLEDHFVLLVQAVATIDRTRRQGEIEHFEFLLRLEDEHGHLISPFQFIQAAERYDLMQQVDRWVIERAVQTICALSPQDRATYGFSINLSGQSAADPTLLSFIAELFDTSGVDPRSIWFEITETAAITHFNNAIALFEGIRSLGSRVALDDFGSGLSSFGYLKSLPVDVIKIDGQFVREIAHNRVDSEMVRAIDRVGKSMGIITVAEFVEDQAILDELIAIGVDYAQGYHIGKPSTIDEALTLRQVRQAS